MIGLGLGLGAFAGRPDPINDILASWTSRVAMNGGSVSATTRAAVRSFLATAVSLGILPRLRRLNLFCGDNLGACLTPQIVGGGHAVETNINFVSGNYTEPSGLQGYGAQYLKTGFTFTKADAIGGVTWKAMGGSANNRVLWGAYNASSSITCSRPGSSLMQRYAIGAPAIIIDSINASGIWSARRAASTDFKVFVHGVQAGSDATASAVQFPPFDVWIYVANANGGASGAAIPYLIGGYAFDDGTIPDAAQPAWRAAWNVFATAIGRPAP
jgi:hypothetical protein